MYNFVYKKNFFRQFSPIVDKYLHIMWTKLSTHYPHFVDNEKKLLNYPE
ncbi:hypothetical protein TAF16_0188 [Anoxybacillus flavithermus]|uniref:Uncharacterized protein n=1 Tax=Anoxybacillus flavithermus TaxID=33934 RepID=A0A178TR55_9BACL|nr:hypothetical protein TAF16_0188 [Anoxybacillus flavithermus]